MFDTATLIAVIAGTFTILAVMISLFLWLRTEANSDRRHFQDIAREDRKDILNLIRSIETEMKDFHYRLLEIEKRK